MNTPLYYAARVIHDPVNKKFIVQYKPKWYNLKWKYDSGYGYYSEYRTEESQLRAATLKANKIVANKIVAQSIVYTIKQTWY